MGQPQSKNGFATSDELPDLTAYITMLDYIKSGGQADVRKARIKIKNESKIVAVKQLRHADEAVKLAHLEMKMWRKANGHANVVQLLGKTLDPRNSPSMVSEFCEHGDLLSYTFSVARFNYKDLLCDILQGLTHIHQLNLAHGDLKPVSLLNESWYPSK
ncbi:kinase-like protein [Ceratobasidium sp. AG-I]|nr:kinase-like protein [Ceratobasidium sp. AG-I]